ncbi:MAG: FtsQ-type POTRA domain-containing protein [Kiritimatiellae bacterium]|nr:FtsQ-type POTRA domain-containing protein [Kiritimatiellia bacterium]
MRLRTGAPLAAAALAVTGVAFAGRVLWGAMFTHNPEYKLETLDIVPGATKTAAEIKALSGVREGDNLFSFGAGEVRERILSAALEIADVEVSKKLPSSLRVAVQDRVPVARICDNRHAVDATGFVFPLVAADVVRHGNLPILDPGDVRIDPPVGRRLASSRGAVPGGPEERLERALRLLVALAARPDYPCGVQYVEAGHPTYLVVFTDDHRMFRVIWEEIPDDESVSDALDLLGAALVEPRAAGNRVFDVMRATRKVHARP